MLTETQIHLWKINWRAKLTNTRCCLQRTEKIPRILIPTPVSTVLKQNGDAGRFNLPTQIIQQLVECIHPLLHKNPIKGNSDNYITSASSRTTQNKSKTHVRTLTDGVDLWNQAAGGWSNGAKLQIWDNRVPEKRIHVGNCNRGMRDNTPTDWYSFNPNGRRDSDDGSHGRRSLWQRRR